MPPAWRPSALHLGDELEHQVHAHTRPGIGTDALNQGGRQGGLLGGFGQGQQDLACQGVGDAVDLNTQHPRGGAEGVAHPLSQRGREPLQGRDRALVRLAIGGR